MDNFQNQRAYPRYPTGGSGGGFTAPPQQSFNDPELEGSVQKVLTSNIKFATILPKGLIT